MILWMLVWISAISIGNVLAKDYRLPSSVKPEFYDLQIITYLCENEYSFFGTVKIKVICIEETNKIVLHSKNLTIFKNKVMVQEMHQKRSINPTNIDFDTENDFLIIKLEKTLKKDSIYKVSITFEGTLDDNLDGYYRSSYFNTTSNTTEWMAVTQFEPTSARQAFPCFDEPAMKAIFKISLGRQEEYMSLSNMPLKTSEPLLSHSGGVLDHFEDTPPMSTYLVAFIVGKFDYKEAAHTPNNVLFRTYARNDAIEQATFATEIGPRALSYFEEYFNITYALPKMDMIAIPDFSAGAMENWGLVTYRETLLLYDRMINSEVSKYGITNVICHELAHQWFGNLVTMKWWTDLWLNEGFATQMAGLATNALYPEWNSLNLDTVTNVLNVFSLDSLKSSHPISVTLQDSKEINEIFDIISYKKGSFLLRTLIYFLGEQTFKDGVSSYLNLHKFNNAEQDDLWEALTLQGHKDGSLSNFLHVKDIMDTWTLQTGYPVVTVTRSYAANTATLMQERFLHDVSLNDGTTEKPPIWWIPITYITQSNQKLNSTQPQYWLNRVRSKNLIHDLSKDEWLLLNVNISALIRVNYDEDNWNLLIRTLQSENYDKIPILNRVQLIDDSAAFAWTGRLSYEVHFNIVNYLVNETNFLPWKAAFNNLEALEKLFRRTSSFGVVTKFFRKLVRPVYALVGGFEERKSSSMMEGTRFQSVVTIWGCLYRIGDCITQAQSLFNQWQEQKSNDVIPKDLRAINYCVAIRNGGDKEWDFLWNQYHASTTPTEKQVILVALGCSRELWILTRYLEYAISNSSGIRKQDIGTIFGAVADNEVGYYVLKNFLYQRLPEIYEYLGSNSKRISRTFMSIASQIVYQHELDEFKRFVSDNKKFLNESTQTIKQAIETAEIQVQWFKNNARTVIEVLTKLSKQSE